MAIDPAPRQPYHPQTRDLTRPPPSPFFSKVSVFWTILMGAVAAVLLIWAFGTGTPLYTSDTNSGPSVRTQPVNPVSPPEPAQNTPPAP
jgi:hypothetical protein